MKIAIPTSDKVTVAPHTGHAQYFMVVTLDGDSVTGTEFRNNPKCGSEHHGESEKADDHGCGCGHDHGHDHSHDHSHDKEDDACCGGHGHNHDHEHGHDDDHGCGCGSHSHEIDEAHLIMAKSIADCDFFILKQLGGKLATPLQRYDIRPVMIRGEALVNVEDIIQEFVAFAKSNEAQHN